MNRSRLVTGFAALVLPFGLTAQLAPGSAAPDSVALRAEQAMLEGRPWQASRLVTPLTRGNPSPAVAILAARAAAGWQGWNAVIRLLHGETWLDRVDNGAGRALLGQAYLERGSATEAAVHTGRALATATDATRGERLLYHARALDRIGELDSAAAVYRQAAEGLPDLRDWLLLRAMGVTRDSTARSALARQVSLPAAKPRLPWTEALARERTGDWRGAILAYQAVGARMAATRLRLAHGDAAQRGAARQDLTAMLAANVSRDESADAIALFDRYFPNRTAAEELRIARRAAQLTQNERAAAGFAAARSILSDHDRFTYATVLLRLGRGAEAVSLFDRLATHDLRARAAYERARLLVRTGQRQAAERALAEIPVKFPDDSIPAASALFLAGDLRADHAADDSARALFVAAATRYPTTAFGQRSAFQAAIIAFLDRDYATAAQEFDRIATSSSGEALAARYWAGRAWSARGDSAAAHQRWTEVARRAPDSYYALLVSRRLGTPFWPSISRPDTAAPRPLPAELRRAKALTELGMRVEARFELDAFERSAAGTSASLRNAARALADGNWHARSVRLAQRAQSDRSVVDLLHPLPYRETLRHEAAAANLDPMLVAGLIRQESLFDPEARSIADARGLMQVIPPLGAQLARQAGLADWDVVLLYQPDVNLAFGVEHLADAFKSLEWPERALAAYNAGTHRVARWRSIRGVDDDPEIFVERIPYVETRDYVRKVLQNQAVYTALWADVR